MSKKNRKPAGSTASIAEIAAEKLPPENVGTGEVIPPTETPKTEEPATESPETPKPATEVIKLMDDAITSVSASWSQAVTRDARLTVKLAVEKMVGNAESKMDVGQAFNKFASKHGEDKANVLIKETARMGFNGLSVGNIFAWRKRSAIMDEHFPNKLVRKFVLALTGGEGIVIRDESSTADPKPYILSPYFSQAIVKYGENDPKDSKTDDVCEKYARQIVYTAKGLRSAAQTEPADARARKRIADFFKWLKGKPLKDHESLVWERLGHHVELLARETTDLDLVLAFVGHLDVVLNKATEDANGKAAGKAA